MNDINSLSVKAVNYIEKVKLYNTNIQMFVNKFCK